MAVSAMQGLLPMLVPTLVLSCNPRHDGAVTHSGPASRSATFWYPLRGGVEGGRRADHRMQRRSAGALTGWRPHAGSRPGGPARATAFTGGSENVIIRRPSPGADGRRSTREAPVEGASGPCPCHPFMRAKGGSHGSATVTWY